MKILYRVLGWVVTVITPVFLILLGVRLVLNPVYPTLAYRSPAFPDDPYGFTLQDRLKWSEYSIKYLLNDSEIKYLADLQFEDSTPIFNQRELGHMVDVKLLVQAVMRTFYGSVVFLVALGLWAHFGKWMSDYRAGISRGGWLTVGLIIGVGLFAAVSFWQFFTLFHSLFFTGDSWLFMYSDTLIRLFPLRFWQDIVLFILGFALISGALLGWFMRPRTGGKAQS